MRDLWDRLQQTLWMLWMRLTWALYDLIGQRPTERFVPVADPDAMVGNLAWTLRDTASGAILGEGSRVVYGRDVTITAHSGRGRIWYSKQVPVADPFWFALSEHPQRPGRAPKGFGLTGGRYDQHTFSWEWFTPDGPAFADKLQEAGRLRVRYARTNCGQELVETELLTDVDLRLHAWGEPIEAGPDWRITLRAGSTIRWPAGDGLPAP